MGVVAWAVPRMGAAGGVAAAASVVAMAAAVVAVGAGGGRGTVGAARRAACHRVLGWALAAARREAAVAAGVAVA